MLLSEFLLLFAEEYVVQYIDDVNSGEFVENITGDIYLVKKNEGMVKRV